MGSAGPGHHGSGPAPRLDVVIPLQMAPDDGAELRYVLRSLEHVPHRYVWLSGWKPTWVRNVNVIRGKKQPNRYADSLANLLRVARHPDTSDQFIYLADDIFALQPNPTLGPFHRGRIHEKTLTYRLPANKLNRQAGHRHGVAQTCAILQRLNVDLPYMSYELHLPIIFDKHQLVDVVERARREATVPALQPRTLYGNYYAVGGDQVDDVKISGRTQLPEPGQQWVSTSDESFRTGQVGRHIRRLYPNPSPYEP